MDAPDVYELTVTYTVAVSDRSALMSAAFDRFAGKFPAQRDTAWLLQQWDGWVRDGTADPATLAPRGIDVALHEFLDEQGVLTPLVGARVASWSSQQRPRPEWPRLDTDHLPPGA